MLWDIMNDPWIPKKTYHEKKKTPEKKDQNLAILRLWPFRDGEKVTLYKWLLVTNPTFGDQVRSRLVWITWCSCLPSRKHRHCRWTKRWTEPPEIALKTLPARPVDGNGEGKCHKWREADFFPCKKKVCCWDLPSHPLTVNTRMTLHFLKVWESQPKPSICYCYWSWGGEVPVYSE